MGRSDSNLEFLPLVSCGRFLWLVALVQAKRSNDTQRRTKLSRISQRIDHLPSFLQEAIISFMSSHFQQSGRGQPYASLVVQAPRFIREGFLCHSTPLIQKHLRFDEVDVAAVVATVVGFSGRLAAIRLQILTLFALTTMDSKMPCGRLCHSKCIECDGLGSLRKKLVRILQELKGFLVGLIRPGNGQLEMGWNPRHVVGASVEVWLFHSLPLVANIGRCIQNCVSLLCCI
jgi:hypothetical protein